jgi:hypothetical protein
MNIYVNLLAAFAWVGVATTTFAQPSADSSVIGTCNTVVQVVEAGDGNKTNLTVNGCPLRGRDSFNVRFIWLDSVSLSFLLSDVTAPPLEKAVGRHPTILKNDIENELRRLYKKYSTAYSVENMDSWILSFTLLTGRSPITLEDVRNIPIRDSTRLRIIDDIQSLVWVDEPATKTFLDSSDWSRGYNFQYTDLESDNIRSYDSHEEFSDSIAQCIVQWKFAAKEEFLDYWERVERLEESIKRGEVLIWDVSPPLGDTGQGLEIPSLTNSGAYGLIKHIGRENWPKDYLLIRGRYRVGTCGGDSLFGYIAEPRKIFVLFAVVEPRADSLQIEGLTIKQDNQTFLRVETVENDQQVVEFSGVPVKRGDSLLIPLRIELRYDLDEIIEGANDVTEAASSSDYSDVLIRSCTAGGDCKVRSRKLIADLPPHLPIDVARKYIYGPSQSLTHIKVNDEWFALKETPRSALVTWMGYDGASCPFLYFTMDDGVERFHGRALVGASSPGASRVERVELPDGTGFVTLKEIEPEVTRVTRLSFRGSRGEEVKSYAGFTLWAGQERRLPVPAHASSVEITGYYETYTGLMEQIAERAGSAR